MFAMKFSLNKTEKLKKQKFECLLEDTEQLYLAISLLMLLKSTNH